MSGITTLCDSVSGMEVGLKVLIKGIVCKGELTRLERSELDFTLELACCVRGGETLKFLELNLSPGGSLSRLPGVSRLKLIVHGRNLKN